ncbi:MULTISPECIES: carbohydrate ABC transporter permease [unclassified Oceanispirochaeta]|uniref:carbohydrate ABC transporter permease n=1 Tax=unclassified Oceanispirochaeta TaxID=2635722 RepID=UPI000E08DC5D|nr:MULTISPECIES: sugar ABC transporter permease [unclassified Oceanispirochaeta]MBF9018462.1 sugar ABC transporter permease [Oceanispirochaeta sp. M2]NPD74868.1 sugar ABC transporter permease [Oceanispirochaeta sp. M1]RDG29256.1 sugar ABC transporter permease [Oceanispirochaeta sp. M1]
MLISRNIHQSKEDKILSWFFLIPVIIVLLLVAFIPLGYGFVFSFFKYKLNMPSIPVRFVGLENYISMFSDVIFLQSLSNNIFFAFLSVILEVFLGIVIAMMLSDSGKVTRFITTVLLIPMVIAPVASGTLWRMMLDRTYGIMNYLISLIGMAPVSWLSDPDIAIYSVIIVDVWQFTPYVAILVLSSIKSIPRSFLESAMVEGASSWRLFRSIIFPIASPVIIIVMMVRFIDAFKVFDTVFVMTQGGPGSSTEMLPTFIYRQGIKFFKVGYSSASAVLFVISMILVSLVFSKLRNNQLRRLN